MKFLALLAFVALAAAVSIEPKTHVRMSSAHPCVLAGTCFSHDWSINTDIDRTILDTKLVFAVKQKNADSCDSLLHEISHPSSKNYGKMYSFEEIGDMFADDHAYSKVMSWLRSEGVERIVGSPNREFITVTVRHAQAEALLNTKFFQFVSEARNGQKLIRALEYYLPADMAKYVDFVGNVISFPSTTIKPSIMMSTNAAASAGAVDIALLNKVYNVDDNVCTNKDSTQSLFESLGQSYSESDLGTFQKQNAIPSEEVAKVIGPNSPALCGILPNQCAEANLDVQYMMGLAQQTATTYWSIKSSSGDIFLEWIQDVAADSNPPLVHSMSYGSVEPQMDAAEMKRFNTEACKLGLRRVTVMISSGDDGVANFAARSSKSGCGFNPSYPAVSPYVTAVGATQGPEDGTAEVACQSDKGGVITTGGGFSVTFDRPSYQDDAYTAYHKTASDLPPDSMYNTAGRGYPDVSLVGHNYKVVIGGSTYLVSGTSASSPSFAALITLVNDARMNAGKNPVGFINPSLYDDSFSSVFKDVTSGNNKCTASSVCCDYGFSAAAGWDPVTGLGSVDFVALKKAFLALP